MMWTACAVALLASPATPLQSLRPAVAAVGAGRASRGSPLSFGGGGVDGGFRRDGVVVKGEEGTPGAFAQGGFNAAGEPPVKIRGFSLAKSFLAAGVLITGASLGQFFLSSGGGSESSLGFIYGIPILLIGCSLQYAELEPVPVEFASDTSEDRAEALFEKKANECMIKIRDDVTRHRYGDEAHLDTTTKALGLAQPGVPYPQLKWLELGDEDGQLAFTMVFESKNTPFVDWVEEKRVKKYSVFFGPNVDAEVLKVDPEKRLVGIKLVTNDE